MNASNSLFNLIKSLSKAEKRYFSLNVLQKSGNKNFARLFKEVEFQTKKGQYDENNIKKKFANEKFVRQLTFTKNYLYNLIVKSLLSFHSNNNIEAEIYNLIISAKIFFRKSLFDNYFISLEKAKLLAEGAEKFGALIEIIKLQMKLVRLKSRHKYKNRNLYEEEQQAILKIQNISDYSKLLHAFYKITKIPDFARSKILHSEVLKIFDNKLLSSDEYALSVTAKDLYYLLNLYKHELTENNSELFLASQKRYELYLNNKKVFSTDSESKELNLSYNRLYYALVAGKMQFYLTHIDAFEKKFVLDKNKPDKEEASYYHLMLRMLYNFKKNRLKEASAYAVRIFDYFRATEAIQNKDELLSVYFICAKLLFEIKNYYKALDVTNLIINHRYKDLRYDILSYSHFLELFIHYELKNYQLVGSYIRSLSRKLSVHKEKDLSEKIILKFFTELISENKIDEEYVFKKYYKQLQSLAKNKYERAFFNELPIDKWIAKKIS